MQLPRWMKQAKINVTLPRGDQLGHHYMSQQAKIGCLHAACSTLHKLAAHSLEAYHEAITDIRQLSMRFHASYLTASQSSTQYNKINRNQIEDSNVVFTKGSATHNKTRALKQR